MRHRLRQVALPALLVLCGVLALSVPSQAAQRGRAVQRQAQRVEVTSQQRAQQADVIHTAWNAIKFQLGSWFGIPVTPVQTPPIVHSTDPQYDGTDPNAMGHVNDVYYDNGGTGAEE